MTSKGLFITFEGPDGCGKTTIINLIYKDLQKKFGKNKVVLTREPGGKNNVVAEDIRNILLNKLSYNICDQTEALLFAASRAQHVKDFIIPNLKKGKIVLCDRYIHSSLVYQGYARGLGIQNVWDINKFAIDNTMPNFTVLLLLDAKTGLERIKQNKQRDVNRLDKEKLEMHNKVYQGYMKISKLYKNKMVVIDASKPVEEVHQDVLSKILKKISKAYVK